AASSLTTAGGPILGGWLTENYGWPWVFAINPPLAAIAVVLLIAYAPPDRHAERRFDIVGAAVLAVALGASAWALRQIGPEQAAGTRFSAWPGCRRRRRGACRFPFLGARYVVSDAPAAADHQSAFCRPERGNAIYLHGAFDHVLSAVVRPRRPTRAVTHKRGACFPAVHTRRWTSVSTIRRAGRQGRREDLANCRAARRGLRPNSIGLGQRCVAGVGRAHSDDVARHLPRIGGRPAYGLGDVERRGCR